MQAIVLLGIFESNDDRDRRGESERNAVFAGKVQIWSIDLKERVLLIGLVSSGRQNLNLYSLMRSQSDRLCTVYRYYLYLQPLPGCQWSRLWIHDFECQAKN